MTEKLQKLLKDFERTGRVCTYLINDGRSTKNHEMDIIWKRWGEIKDFLHDLLLFDFIVQATYDSYLYKIYLLREDMLEKIREL